MELSDYFIFAFPILVIELIAATAGIFYLKKVPATAIKNRTKLLIYFLIFNFLVELFATYAVIGYFSDYKYFSFIQDSSIRRNMWIYNIFTPLTAVFYSYYFLTHVRKPMIKNIMYAAMGLYTLGILAHHLSANIFFDSYSTFSSICGSFLVLISIALFFFEVLKSDIILSLNRYLPFYIAIGTLVFNLCITPIFLFSDYFSTSSGNISFVKLHLHVVLYSNIFMYSCFILGFILCSKKKKSSY